MVRYSTLRQIKKRKTPGLQRLQPPLTHTPPVHIDFANPHLLWATTHHPHELTNSNRLKAFVCLAASDSISELQAPSSFEV